MRSDRASFVLCTIAWACGGEPNEPAARPVPTFELAAAPKPVMECRFEGVTQSAEPARSGGDMCFSGGEPEPWWMQYRAENDAAPPADELDAGANPEPPCPPEMVLVEGSYCPDTRQRCLRYLDDGVPGAFMAHNRCAEYDANPTCAAPREHRRFCIDRDEYVAEGAELPLVDQSWTTAKELCESHGKRLCFESEWQFACEGEKLLPYPYGLKRNAKLCNHDLTDLEYQGKLRDKRVRPADRPGCVSPLGVRNMVGNVDEWAYRDGMQTPWRAALRGGWWLAGRNNCGASTTGHDEYYFGKQTGVRCCASAR